MKTIKNIVVVFDNGDVMPLDARTVNLTDNETGESMLHDWAWSEDKPQEPLND